jgi:menaquinol-cytochrome c reductase cytochrome b/c subunit
MTEIPEHLRKRAEEAKAKAAAAKGEAAPADAPAADAPAAADAPKSEAESKIPAHLLERSKAAKAKAGGTEVAEADAPAGGGVATATAPPTNAPPVGVGPGGHTQRLLTVVKSGSIQDVKATPVDKVHVWPHLLLVEFVASLACTAFLLVFSIFVNAPLLELSNPNQTPNPSKAPWYFLGLQELLKWFHPMVAGVLLPGMGLVALILAPYTDRNPSNKPEDRKFAVSLFTLFLIFWAVLVIIGTFFRGPGFNFIFPWNDGLFVEL